MAKLTLNDIVNTYNVALINSNFTKIEDEFQNKVLYRDNPSGEPNNMASSIDMNGNRILNLPAPSSPNEPARLADVSGLGDITALVQQAEQSADAALVSEQAAQAYAGQAAASAAGAASAAIAAETFAEGLIGSSSTSSDYTLGTKVFVTQSGKQFNPGQFITITDTTTPSNFMLAQVLSYSGSNLTVDVTASNGTGTWSSWNISVSGVQGPEGDQGLQGPAGPAGSALIVKDEGVSLTTAATEMDFVGAGVTVTNVGDVVTVTIPGGGGGSSITAKDEGVDLTTGMTSIDFVGAGVTASAVGTDVTVNIPSINLANTTSIGGASGSESLRVVQAPASSVNRVEIVGNTTGNAPSVGVNGSDTDITFNIYSKGTSPLRFFSNEGTDEQFRISHTASSVNFAQAKGGAAGAPPRIDFIGSDTDVGAYYNTKGAAQHDFATNGNTQFRIAPVTSAINFTQVSGAAAGSPVRWSAKGGDTNVGSLYETQGSASHDFYTHGAKQFVVSGQASAVNFVQTSGATTGNGVSVTAGGSDTNVSLNLMSKGSGSVNHYTAAGTLQFRVGHVASAVNYVASYGGTAGGRVLLRSEGTDSTIPIALCAKDSSVQFFTDSNQSARGFNVAHQAGAINYVQAQGSVTAQAPTLTATGSDTNIDFGFVTKGTGKFQFYANAAERMRITDTGELKFVNNTVTAITAAGNHRLQSYATGSLPSASTEGSGAVVRDSTTGELKMSDGSAWAAVGSGSGGATIGNRVLLATLTASSSSALDYTGIDTTYDEYVCELFNVKLSSSASVLVRLFNSGSVVTTTTYRYAVSTITESVQSGFGSAGNSSVSISGGSGVGSGVYGTVRLFKQSDNVVGLSETTTFSSNPDTQYFSGGFRNESITNMTGVRFFPGAGNFSSGTIKIYGIKKT